MPRRRVVRECRASTPLGGERLIINLIFIFVFVVFYLVIVCVVCVAVVSSVVLSLGCAALASVI